MLLPCSGRGRKVLRLPGIAALLVLPAILTSLSGYMLLNADQVERSASRVTQRGAAAALVAPTGETVVELVDASDQAPGKPAGSAPATPVTVVADGEDLQVAVAEGATVGTVLRRLNLQVDEDGNGRLETMNERVTLGSGPTSILDADGSALVVHGAPDDFKTDPTGNSGARIACGVIARSRPASAPEAPTRPGGY